MSYRVWMFVVCAFWALWGLAACGNPGPVHAPPSPSIAPVSLPPPLAAADEAELQALARTLADGSVRRDTGPADPPDQDLDDRFRIQLAAGRFGDALVTLRSYRDRRRAADPLLADAAMVVFDIYATARSDQAVSFGDAYSRAFRAAFATLDPKAAYYALGYIRDDLTAFRADLQSALVQQPIRERSPAESIALIRSYQVYEMYRATLPLLPALIGEDDARRYQVDDNLAIRTASGVTLSALVYRPRGGPMRAPAALCVSIYTDASRGLAREAAAHGYIGVAVETRGKRNSLDPIVPYERDAEDVYAVIDWVSKQPWSDGQVGMWGNSYLGFTQWAATKRLHPALKTIVPSAAAIPGLGLPMENNVFLNANYGWAFYVTNNRLLDNQVYFDNARWRALNHRWYESGRPYREIDQIDGTPNPWLQRWLAHPSYDAYWQAMVPFRDDYTKIQIPVLTITGYYDDGQISALHYLREHVNYNPRAEHYLLIGPYQHFTAQAARKPFAVAGYPIDPAAQINTKAIIFQWMDYVMRGGARPALLADKINFEVMGANQWRHAPSIERMSTDALTLYLADARADSSPAGYRTLTPVRPAQPGYLEQTVDFADRTTSTNDYYYPSPIITGPLELSSGYAYVSAPFDAPVSVNGMLSGELRVTIDKRDVDVNVVLYELMPDGRQFHLSYFLGRASYAHDMTQRRLLTPGAVESIPFDRSRMVSRQLQADSRLLVVVNVNKNPFAQVNHGTGGDVSDESSTGATPLHIRWHTDSYVRIPISR